VPQQIPQPGGQVRPQGPSSVQPPPLRTPQQVLTESKQRFPKVDEQVLRGAKGLPGLTFEQQDMLRELSHKSLSDQTPVIIGQGDSFKIALMPTKGVPGPNPGLTIQQYVKEGQALYERIMSGDRTEMLLHGKDEVAKLMWFLQALGSAKASESSGQNPPSPAMFKEGAFSIEDPDRRLEIYLLLAHSYPRPSSHLKGFQEWFDGHPKGVDVRGVPMPNERKTVLFARMPGSDDVEPGAPNIGPKCRIFLKMEEHGCRGLSIEGTGRASDRPPSLGKKLSRFFANIVDYLGHGVGFARSIGERIGLLAKERQDNRERIPGDVKKLYGDFQSMAKGLGQGVEELLGRDAPLSDTGGIRVMIRNLEALRDQFKSLSPEVRAKEPFASFGPRLDNAVTILRNHGDNPELRIGNEIILNAEDMKIGNPVPMMGLRQPVTQEGTLDQQSREVILAGYSYVLADINQHDEVKQFEFDTYRCTYQIGHLGNEKEIKRDPQNLKAAVLDAKAAVLDLADGDPRIAKALMTMANQGLAEPLANLLSNDSLKSLQAMLNPKGSNYHIIRLPDTPEGAKVFRVGYTFAGPISEDGDLGALDGAVPIDQKNSGASGQIWLEVTCSNGVMEPKIHGDPSYAFTFTPAPAH
jgi:hypothetical protein